MRQNIILITILLFITGYAQAQRIVLTPQWVPQAQFAGYYVAEELGYYEEAGVDVSIEHAPASEVHIKRLVSGQCNAVTMQLLDALYHIDRGVDMVNILQTSQRSGTLIIPRHENIKSIDDLRGHRIGIWRSNFSQLAQFIDQDKHLNIEWVPFVQSINLYISGAIDATLAMTYNEQYWIEASGFEHINEIRLGDLGYDYPEDGLYISTEYFKKYPEKAKAFAEASRKGWLWVHENPEEALEIVLNRMERENVPYNRSHQRWMLQEILKLQYPQNKKKPNFVLEADKVVNLSNLLRVHNRIETHFTIDKLQGK